MGEKKSPTRKPTTLPPNPISTNSVSPSRAATTGPRPSAVHRHCRPTPRVPPYLRNLNMHDSTTILTGVGAVACSLAVYWLWKKRTSYDYSLPPSPTYYPLIGNLPSMPTTAPHIGLFELGKKLKADMFSLNVLGTLLIVLNKSEDAVNLLEKRSGIYSDRICPPMAGDPSLMNWGGFISMLGYNDRWRKSRRLMHPWLHKKAAEAFHLSQEHQTRLLLQRLLDASDSLGTSDELESEIYRMSAATLAKSIYGYELHSNEDPFILQMKEAMDNITRAALPSNFLVNFFPALVHIPEWFPGAKWKQTAREWREQKDQAVNTAYGWSKAQSTKGANDQSIVASMLEHAERLELEPSEIDDYIKEVAVTLFAGGTDTTTNTLLVLIQALLLFPDIQQKAQKEIDAVVGFSRLPNMEDRPKLGYVDRLVLEVLRWRPTVPGGFAHACYEDDVYKGYRIPKGALVLGNVWAITRNPEVYPDPEIFDPDRYLDPQVPPAPTFGFGRRLCPGIHFANASLFIAAASILATFNISMVKDASGNDVVPVVESEDSVIYHPKSFQLRLVPRTHAHSELIRASI